MRKVQQSAALLERQRNPGVGYWSGKGQSNGTGGNGAESPVRHRASESSEVLSPPGSPRAGSPAVSQRSEEDVNLEYLRNVILQFLEHKEMRVRNSWLFLLFVFTHLSIAKSRARPFDHSAVHTARDASPNSESVKYLAMSVSRVLSFFGWNTILHLL